MTPFTGSQRVNVCYYDITMALWLQSDGMSSSVTRSEQEGYLECCAVGRMSDLGSLSGFSASGSRFLLIRMLLHPVDQGYEEQPA